MYYPTTMIEARDKHNASIQGLRRVIGNIKGRQPGPSIIFTGGIHGNEKSGVIALQQATEILQKKTESMRGHFYALAGNLSALRQEKRYQSADLNRLWTADRMQLVKKGEFIPQNEDETEQVELYNCLRSILNQDAGPFYFMDLHTTSSHTIPFIVVNDSLLNRKFTSQYPLPMILGIEEYLEGPLLSYINELGYVAFGFEAGQHDDPNSADNHLAFIMLSMAFAGLLPKSDIDFNQYQTTLARHSVESLHFYEIFYRYRIHSGEKFKMAPGYVNFQKVKKGQQLASSNGIPIIANRNARVFMPLYQKEGTEGFFAIRKVPVGFLKLSKIIRKLHLDRFVALLPGVSWADKNHETLKVNLKVARFFTKPIFHLMGYRSHRLDRDHYLMKNRESASRTREYQSESWY